MATARSVILAVVNYTQLMQMQDFFGISFDIQLLGTLVKAGGAAGTGRH